MVFKSHKKIILQVLGLLSLTINFMNSLEENINVNVWLSIVKKLKKFHS